MADYELPLMISAKYLPEWSVWEGVRELVQNWHDGVLKAFERDHSFKESRLLFEKHETEDHVRHVARVRSTTENFSGVLRETLDRPDMEMDAFEEQFLKEMDLEEIQETVGHLIFDKRHGTLTMINYKTTVERSALLMGCSSKSLHHQSIGQFGEGLKIGALALVRSKMSVCVDTGPEQWEFVVKQHCQLKDEAVLTVCIRRRTDGQTSVGDSEASAPLMPSFVAVSSEDTCTQIHALDHAQWNEFSKRFLFLEGANEMVDTEVGALLLDRHLAGQMFVKQIWIKDMEHRLSRGVDVKELELDRDRRCAANPIQVEHYISMIWAKAMKRRPALHGLFYNMLTDKESKSVDVKFANYYVEDMESIQMITNAFFQQYGEEAYPVLDTETHDNINRLEQEFQRRIVVVNQSLHAILQRSHHMQKIREMFGSKRRALRPLAELAEEQMSVFHHAMGLVRILDPGFPAEKVDVLDAEEEELVLNPRDNHFEVPLYMLNNAEMHARRIRHPCGDTQNACTCAATYLALQLLSMHTSVPNPAMRLYGWMNHLSTQLAKGSASPAYCLHIHQHPPLTQDQKEHFMAVLRKKEDQLLSKKTEFEQGLQQQATAHEEELRAMSEQLTEARDQATHAELKLYDVALEMQDKMTNQRDKLTSHFQRLRAGYTKRLEKLKQDREELLKQRAHMETKSEKEQHRVKVEEDRYLKKIEEIKTRLSWLVDILLERVKGIVAFREAGVPSNLPESSPIAKLFLSMMHSFDEQLNEECHVCFVCCQQPRNTFFEPCKHCIVCHECSMKITQMKGKCPYCKDVIKQVVTVAPPAPGQRQTNEEQAMDSS